jgi:hypothetical protein
MSLTERVVRGLSSRRVQDIAPPEERPTPFQTVGGWSYAADASAALADDPLTAERTARASGAHALAALEAERIERAAAERDRNLGSAPRGFDFTRGLNYREGV